MPCDTSSLGPRPLKKGKRGGDGKEKRKGGRRKNSNNKTHGTLPPFQRLELNCAKFLRRSYTFSPSPFPRENIGFLF